MKKDDDETVDRKKEVEELPLQDKTEIIFDAHSDLLKSDRRSSLLAIKLGRHLIAAKILVKKQEESWEDYCENTLSDIERHEIRDCMYIASQYRKNPLPCLYMIKRTNLYKFFQFCKGKSPKEVLTQTGIDLITKDAPAEEIRAFGVKVLRLLQSAKKKKGTARKKSNGKAVQQSSDKTDPKSNTLRYHRKGLLQLMESELRKPKRQLKQLTPQALRYYLDLQKTLDQFIKTLTPSKCED